ncbi:HNH endonuclease signature motif containing protein [Acinetobacter sp. WCHAc060025]|uniref:HNH endonuclease signature motif containing protein n=1 Tax=Acinetobacter sp. WCHAc060025 TaxID=2518625 RepID=UPI001022B441|nr:HNH endonuclease signature motif containing protein [Acinetobacter sp. WCHAc060025]RZG78268.1 HNH endonuclease [Acinetobacter sp. WCHAc060025]
MAKRKKLADKDIKSLWALSAGICANPSCNRNIIESTINHSLVVIGEQAHIIAHSADGPRNNQDRLINDVDSVENLILLCSTCHTLIDKAEQDYPIELLREWKNKHEEKVQTIFKDKKFDNLNSLKLEIKKILDENYYLFNQYGPRSEASQNLLSNTVELWHKHIIEDILPNNRKIINLIENNIELWTNNLVFIKMKAHVNAYEVHFSNPLENYQLFPIEFKEYIYE